MTSNPWWQIVSCFTSTFYIPKPATLIPGVYFLSPRQWSIITVWDASTETTVQLQNSHFPDIVTSIENGFTLLARVVCLTFCDNDDDDSRIDNFFSTLFSSLKIWGQINFFLYYKVMWLDFVYLHGFIKSLSKEKDIPCLDYTTDHLPKCCFFLSEFDSHREYTIFITLDTIFIHFVYLMPRIMMKTTLQAKAKCCLAKSRALLWNISKKVQHWRVATWFVKFNVVLHFFHSRFYESGGVMQFYIFFEIPRRH